MARILLVEDDQLTRELYEKVLKDAGYTVDSARDGKEGWEKASQGGYDIILLDIILPYTDGITILKKLQTNPPTPPNKKIVMLTVLNQDNIIKDALANGAHGFLMKTALTPAQVLAEINGFLTA